jgi:hypothetical protein
MIKLSYVTNGKITIEVEGFTFGFHEIDPSDNVKRYFVESNKLELEVTDMKWFSEWGVIELVPCKDSHRRSIKVTCDATSWGCYATAQMVLERNGQVVFNDNFQSSLKGPIGDSKRTKEYPVIDYSIRKRVIDLIKKAS